MPTRTSSPSWACVWTRRIGRSLALATRYTATVTAWSPVRLGKSVTRTASVNTRTVLQHRKCACPLSLTVGVHRALVCVSLRNLTSPVSASWNTATAGTGRAVRVVSEPCGDSTLLKLLKRGKVLFTPQLLLLLAPPSQCVIVAASACVTHSDSESTHYQ